MGRTITLPLLDQVRVAAPCPATWDSMAGDDRTRFCSQCSLSVNNISGLTRDEAEAFLHRIAEREKAGRPERVCIHFYRRPDGTILTQNCPVGVALWKRRARRATARAVAAAGALFASVAAFGSPNWRHNGGLRARQVEPFRTVAEWLAPASAPAPRNSVRFLGEMAAPSPPTTPVQSPATRN